jgi:hypothetical protein
MQANIPVLLEERNSTLSFDFDFDPTGLPELATDEQKASIFAGANGMTVNFPDKLREYMQR